MDPPAEVRPRRRCVPGSERRFRWRCATARAGRCGSCPRPPICSAAAAAGSRQRCSSARRRDVQLEPNESRDIVIAATVPADAAPGCYSGLLVVTGAGLPARPDHDRRRVNRRSRSSAADPRAAPGPPEVVGFEPFRERAVDRGEHVAGGLPTAGVAQETPRASSSCAAPTTVACCSRAHPIDARSATSASVRLALAHQHPALEPQRLRQPHALVPSGPLDLRQALLDQVQAVVEVARTAPAPRRAPTSCRER